MSISPIHKACILGKMPIGEIHPLDQFAKALDIRVGGGSGSGVCAKWTILSERARKPYSRWHSAYESSLGAFRSAEKGTSLVRSPSSVLGARFNVAMSASSELDSLLLCEVLDDCRGVANAIQVILQEGFVKCEHANAERRLHLVVDHER